MDLLTAGVLITSLLAGFLLGFLTISKVDIKVKLVIDAFGAFILILAIWVLMQPLSPEAPLNNMLQGTVDFIQTARGALIVYVAGDAIGSLGYMISSGSC